MKDGKSRGRHLRFQTYFSNSGNQEEPGWVLEVGNREPEGNLEFS